MQEYILYVLPGIEKFATSYFYLSPVEINSRGKECYNKFIDINLINYIKIIRWDYNSLELSRIEILWRGTNPDLNELKLLAEIHKIR